MPTLAPGQRIGEYVLEERIGQGAFGDVWRARHHVWSEQVAAVKVPTDPQYVRQLQREGRAMHGLQHPNVVRALNFDPYADPPYLVTEYVPGVSLRQLLTRRPALPAADAVAILRQVLSGLEHAHAHGVVHRDVKPENVLIHGRAFVEGFAAEGVVRLTDFGLGRATAPAAAGQSIVLSQEAREDGRPGGTHFYMAPEQAAGGTVDGRADLYACGVMLLEMLTGERPAGTEVPSELNPDVPPHLDDAFRRAYARLDRRFASAAEFAAALQPPVASAPPAPPSAAPAHVVGAAVLAPVPAPAPAPQPPGRPPLTWMQRGMGGAMAGTAAGFAVSLLAVPWCGPSVLAMGALVGAVIGATMELRQPPESYFLTMIAGMLAGAVVGQYTVGAVAGFLAGSAAALIAVTLAARSRAAERAAAARRAGSPPNPAGDRDRDRPARAAPAPRRRRRNQAPEGVWPPPPAR